MDAAPDASQPPVVYGGPNAAAITAAAVGEPAAAAALHGDFAAAEAAATNSVPGTPEGALVLFGGDEPDYDVELPLDSTQDNIHFRKHHVRFFKDRCVVITWIGFRGENWNSWFLFQQVIKVN